MRFASATATSGKSRHDQVTALLVGVIAIIVAVLVVVQVAVSHEGARAEAAAARLASATSTGAVVALAPLGFQLAKSLEATHVAMGGTSRQLVSLEADDAVGQAIGGAEQAALERLMAVAQEMGAVPDASSPLDPYARETLALTLAQVRELSEEQNRQLALALDAGGRGTAAVLGLSLAALAGVLVGLAAVVGKGRPGGALLVLGFVVAGGALVVAAVSSGWLPPR